MNKTIVFSILMSIATITFSQKLQETRRYNAPETVKIDGKMLVRFHQAEEVEVVIETEKVSLEDIYTKYSGDELLIRVEPLDIEGGSVVIDVYLPAFSELTITRGAATHISSNMLKNNAKVTAKTGATLKADLNIENFTAKIGSGAFLELFGTLKQLDATIYATGKLRTDSLNLQIANIKARSGGFAAINPKESADLKAHTGGEIKLLIPVKKKKINTFMKGVIIQTDIDKQ